jgi:hypothetical protein
VEAAISESATMGGRRRQAVWGGTVAGLVGALAYVAFSLAADVVRGSDLWVALKVAAYPLVGEKVMAPGLDLGTVLQGLLTHLGISLAWGVLFGVAAFGMTRAATVGFGLIWGVFVWIAMFYFVLPFAGATVTMRGVPLLLTIGQHLVFGLALGLGFLAHQRPVLRRPAWEHPVPFSGSLAEASGI